MRAVSGVARAFGDGRSEYRARTGSDVAAGSRRQQAAVGVAGWSRGPCPPIGERLRGVGARRGRPGPARALARDRLRLRDRHLFHRRPGAGALGGGRAASSPRLRRVIFVAQPADRVSRWRSRSRPPSAGFPTATVKRRLIAHPVLAGRRSGTSTSRASSRCARSASAPTASSCAFTASTGARLEQPLERVRVSVRKGTAPPVGSYRRVQGAAVAAARAAAARRLRLRARHVFPGHRRVRLRAGPHPHRGAAAAPGLLAALRRRPSTACATRIDRRIRAVLPRRHAARSPRR